MRVFLHSIVVVFVATVVFAPVLLAQSRSFEAESLNKGAVDVINDSSASNNQYVHFMSVGQAGDLPGCKNIRITRENPSDLHVYSVRADYTETESFSLFVASLSHYFKNETEFLSEPALNNSNNPSQDPLQIRLNPDSYRSGVNTLTVTLISTTNAIARCRMQFVFEASGADIARWQSCSVYANSNDRSSRQRMRMVVDSHGVDFSNVYATVSHGQPLANVAFPKIGSGEVSEDVEIDFGASGQNRTGSVGILMVSQEFADSYICTAFADIDAQQVGWNPPAGVDLLDPRPYLSQLLPTNSLSQTNGVLNQYFKDRYDRSRARSYGPVFQTRTEVVDASAALPYYTPIEYLDSTLASDRAQFAATAHAIITSYSRIPLKVTSKIRVDRLRFVRSMAGAGAYATCRWNSGSCADDYQNVFQTKYLDASRRNNKVHYSIYPWYMETVPHELAHIFDYHYLQNVLKQASAFPTDSIGNRYAPFKQANPPYFTKYGADGVGTPLQVNRSGYYVGFDSNYAKTTQYEDIAETFAPFFAHESWQRTDGHIHSSVADDPYYRAKQRDILSKLQQMDPALNDATIEKLSQLPTFAVPQ